MNNEPHEIPPLPTKLSIQAKKLSELVADFERSTDSIKYELTELKATMFVNFCQEQNRNPKILNDSDKSALNMLMSILDFYMAENKALREQISEKALQFKAQFLPNAETPFHHEAEGWYAVYKFLNWLNATPPAPNEEVAK